MLSWCFCNPQRTHRWVDGCSYCKMCEPSSCLWQKHSQHILTVCWPAAICCREPQKTMLPKFNLSKVSNFPNSRTWWWLFWVTRTCVCVWVCVQIPSEARREPVMIPRSWGHRPLWSTNVDARNPAEVAWKSSIYYQTTEPSLLTLSLCCYCNNCI